MKSRLAEYVYSRDNNFNLLRFVAASLVLLSHSYPLSLGPDTPEPLVSSFGITLGGLAVDIFFITSGFLVAASLYSRSLVAYLWARFVRIYPALVVAVLFCVFVVGMAFTTVGAAEYLTDSTTLKFLVEKLDPFLRGEVQTAWGFRGIALRKGRQRLSLDPPERGEVLRLPRDGGLRLDAFGETLRQERAEDGVPRVGRRRPRPRHLELFFQVFHLHLHSPLRHVLRGRGFFRLARKNHDSQGAPSRSRRLPFWPPRSISRCSRWPTGFFWLTWSSSLPLSRADGSGISTRSATTPTACTFTPSRFSSRSWR